MPTVTRGRKVGARLVEAEMGSHSEEESESESESEAEAEAPAKPPRPTTTTTTTNVTMTGRPTRTAATTTTTTRITPPPALAALLTTTTHVGPLPLTESSVKPSLVVDAPTDAFGLVLPPPPPPRKRGRPRKLRPHEELAAKKAAAAQAAGALSSVATHPAIKAAVEAKRRAALMPQTPAASATDAAGGTKSYDELVADEVARMQAEAQAAENKKKTRKKYTKSTTATASAGDATPRKRGRPSMSSKLEALVKERANATVPLVSFELPAAPLPGTSVRAALPQVGSKVPWTLEELGARASVAELAPMVRLAEAPKPSSASTFASASAPPPHYHHQPQPQQSHQLAAKLSAPKLPEKPTPHTLLALKRRIVARVLNATERGTLVSEIQLEFAQEDEALVEAVWAWMVRCGDFRVWSGKRTLDASREAAVAQFRDEAAWRGWRIGATRDSLFHLLALVPRVSGGTAVAVAAAPPAPAAEQDPTLLMVGDETTHQPPTLAELTEALWPPTALQLTTSGGAALLTTLGAQHGTHARVVALVRRLHAVPLRALHAASVVRGCTDHSNAADETRAAMVVRAVRAVVADGLDGISLAPAFDEEWVIDDHATGFDVSRAMLMWRTRAMRAWRGATGTTTTADAATELKAVSLTRMPNVWVRPVPSDDALPRAIRRALLMLASGVVFSPDTKDGDGLLSCAWGDGEDDDDAAATSTTCDALVALANAGWCEWNPRIDRMAAPAPRSPWQAVCRFVVSSSVRRCVAWSRVCETLCASPSRPPEVDFHALEEAESSASADVATSASTMPCWRGAPGVFASLVRRAVALRVAKPTADVASLLAPVVGRRDAELLCSLLPLT